MSINKWYYKLRISLRESHVCKRVCRGETLNGETTLNLNFFLSVSIKGYCTSIWTPDCARTQQVYCANLEKHLAQRHSVISHYSYARKSHTNRQVQVMARANRKTGTGTIAQQPCEIEPPPLLTSRFGDEGTQLFGLSVLKQTINDAQTGTAYMHLTCSA